MSPETFVATALEPGLGLLRVDMDSLEARAFLVAVGLHESKLSARRQFKGPARSYLMFERAGVNGVLKHPASRDHIAAVLLRLDYGALQRRPRALVDILEHHDPLAIVFGRLLLRSVSAPLPTKDQAMVAYEQYRAAWKPNPQKADLRRHEWPDVWSEAWQIVERVL